MSHPARLAIFAVSLLLPSGAAQAASDEPASSLRSGREKCDRAQFRVILDVGHTAEVPGAMSARGISEYEFNLRLGRDIKQRLLDAGFARTALLITAGPARPSLFKRVALANRAPADLFLSIHHDSVPASFMETWEYDGKQNRFSDRFKGHSLFVSYDNAARRASLLFAGLLGARLKQRGLQYAPHYTEPFMGLRQRELVDAEAGVYRYDQLVVLRMTRMPAVLLEAGSIIHRDEELQMGSPERQSLIGEAVTEAVETFCAARSRRRPPRPGGLEAAGQTRPAAAAQAHPRR